MKTIAFITKFSWVGISTSVINSALFWESKGFEVDIYVEQPNQDKFPLPKFKNKQINIIVTEIRRKFLIDDLYFSTFHFKKKNYKVIIGFDHSGLIRAGIASFFYSNKNIIYHSLEFFEPFKNNFRIGFEKKLESYFSKKAKYIFVQDEFRGDFLKNSLGFNQDKIRYVYNSPTGKNNETKSNYFRELFGIGNDKTIILCIGSIIKEHCIHLLLNSISILDEKFVLVLHGWFPQEELKQLTESKKKQFPERVFISTNLFDNQDKYIPYQASDIGFVGFLPINNNLKYAAGSAGKLFDFMKVGLPVLAFNTPGMKEIVKDNAIGEIFSDEELIPEKLSIINDNYSTYRLNCLATFSNYEFNRQYDTMLTSLNPNIQPFIIDKANSI